MKGSPSEGEARYAAEDLRAFCREALLRLGAGEEGAAISADALVRADLRGVESHGVMRLPLYAERIRRGLIDPGAEPELLRDEGATALLDARHGLGFLTGRRAMDLALAKAEALGAGFVAVRNGLHLGALEYHVLPAAERDFLGACATNSGASIPPWGGRKALSGNNPFAIALPAGGLPPVVLDMAFSVSARGRIRLALAEGREIPPGWATDKEGKPTRDPRAAMESGNLLGIGGYKGVGLSLAVDLLTGVLTGGGFGPEVSNLFDMRRKQSSSHLFAALRIADFVEPSAFKARVAAFLQTLKAQPRAAGFEEIRYPGERRYRLEQERLREGIPLSAAVRESLEGLARELGLNPPSPLS